jgi:hypothetical protein
MTTRNETANGGLPRALLAPLAAVALALPAASAVAQDAPDQAQRPIVRLLNLGGPLDYAEVPAPNGRVAGPLIAAAGRAELQHELSSTETRGVRVFINHQALDALSGSDDPRLTIPTLDGCTLKIIIREARRQDSQTTVWLGQIAGIPFSDVILVRRGEGFLADIRDRQNRQRLKIRMTPDGGHALREAPMDRPRGVCGGCSQTVDGGRGFDDQMNATDSSQHPAGTAEGGLRDTVVDPANEIDILFIATAQARAGYGTSNAFVLEAIAAVEDFNLRASNTGLPTRLRLVAADWDLAAGYSEGTTGDDDIAAMRSTPTPGALFAPLQSARERYRFDLVAMIREEIWNSSIFGGTLGAAPRPQTLSNLGPTNGISVNARDGDIADGLVAHEVGHNFGMCHDIATSQTDGTCVLPNSPSIRPDARGHVANCFLTAGLTTTMAYSNGLFESGVPIFSRADIVIDVGFPCGTLAFGVVGFAENFRTALETQDELSRYRTHATLAWAAPNALPLGLQGEGTYLYPLLRLDTAVAQVQGGFEQAVVRAKAGTYLNIAANGGNPIVLNGSTRIDADGGPVIIR